jgi:hypothetical protein
MTLTIRNCREFSLIRVVVLLLGVYMQESFHSRDFIILHVVDNKLHCDLFLCLVDYSVYRLLMCL